MLQPRLVSRSCWYDFPITASRYESFTRLLVLVVDHELVPLPLPDLEHGGDVKPAQGIVNTSCRSVVGKMGSKAAVEARKGAPCSMWRIEHWKQREFQTCGFSSEAACDARARLCNCGINWGQIG